MNEISCEGVEGLVQGLEVLTGLTTLEINLKNNTVGEEGAEKLSECLEKMTGLLSLNINFGGYSQVQNKLKEAGAKKVLRSISKMKDLEVLELDLGYTGVTDICALELATSLKGLNSL